MREKTTEANSEERETQSVADLLTLILTEVKQQVQSEVRQQIQCEARQIQRQSRQQDLIGAPEVLTGKAQEALELFAKIRATLALQPAPTIELTANRDTVPVGESVILNWSSTNARTVSIVGKKADGTINNNIMNLDPVGSIEVTIFERTVFTAAATGPCGSESVAVTIAVPVIE